MAIQAPALLLRVVQFNVAVLILEFSPFGVDFHSCMAVAAGENPRGKGGGHRREIPDADLLLTRAR